ncbi:hypothetical protein [Croceicoccus sp. YJ47]|uniref:hypothetical protein n=1 Tax=Croceicoccus sp. YJ47 TaxID=2798724 RepID=UPI001920D979|nr:hypothetical protein [Croceicoccus sp. YJ47]QQN74367.1 hypothetical protein JD971_00740 [Croceicoccus sp. YJ47]
MTLYEIVIALVIVLLTVTAWMVSTRRNNREIDNLDCEDVNQLKICLADWLLSRAEKKLYKLGWQLVRTESRPQRRVCAWFERTNSETALSLKDVLNRLNRAGYLSAVPMTLTKEEGQPPA